MLPRTTEEASFVAFTTARGEENMAEEEGPGMNCVLVLKVFYSLTKRELVPSLFR